MGDSLRDIVKKMFEPELDVKSFPTFLAGYNFGRGLFSDQKDSPHIVASHQVLVWRVIQDEVERKEIEKILFDGENYVIEWHFDYVLNVGSDIKREIFFFHWKGMNAVKGFSPLPSDRNLENAIVERIYQWGEPPVFFHIFPNKLIVLRGKEDDFKPSRPHLFMLRGEIINELHLFELPCCWKNFRSRAIFFLIMPNKKRIYIWFGSCVNPVLIKTVKECKTLYSSIENVHKSWRGFKFVEVPESDDGDMLEDELEDTRYLSIKNMTVMFTPRLFYLVFNGDAVNPVEIKYPLQTPKVEASFPFVQSHLYSAAQPAIFLLDNYNEIWLWKGVFKTDTDMENFNEQFKIAEDLLNEYVKNKKLQAVDVTVQHIDAGQEPMEFTNIFPYWKS